MGSLSLACAFSQSGTPRGMSDSLKRSSEICSPTSPWGCSSALSGGQLGKSLCYKLGEADEAELQRLVAAEQQKAQFTAQVHHFMELCWDKCVEKPGNRLDSRTENCLSSCVDRFIDTTLAITSRFAQIVQKGGQ